MYYIFRINGIKARLVKCFIIAGLIFNALLADGQEHGLYFDSFKVKDGLPNNSVMAITQDSSGYIWAATRYGLVRYDGVNFKTFKHEDGNSGSIVSNEILKDIKTDHQGRLWVASRELELYHPETETFEKIPTGLLGIKAIYCDSKNRIFLGARGKLEYFENSNPHTLQTIDLDIDKNNQVNTLYEDVQHHLWVGTSNGLFQIDFDKQKAVLVDNPATRQFAKNDITAIAQDKNQNLWIGTRANGLYCYNTQSGTFESFFKNRSINNSLIDNHIRKIIVTKNGTLWIGTQEGLSIFNIDDRKFYNFRHDTPDPHSISDNSIFNIFQDRAGSVWIATYFGGLNVVHTENTPFTIFQNNTYKNSLNNNIISAITEDTHHNVWIGTEVSGLNFWDKKTGRFSAFKNDVDNQNSLSSNLVKAIAIDQQGDVYIGTATGGLNIYHPATGKFEHYWYTGQKTVPDITGDDIRCLLVTDKNEVLVGTGNGLKVFLKTQRKFISQDTGLTAHAWVTALFENKNHEVWVGASNGLFKLTASGQLERELFFNSSARHTPLAYEVNCLQEDRSGRLWAGLKYQGLALLDQKKHIFRIFTMHDGLPGNNVLGILVDAADNLWISTDNGLSKFDASNGRFQNLTVEDGLPDNQFNKGSYYNEGDSTFYFGTYNGMISFNPAKIIRNQISPKVVFSYIKLFNQPLSIDQQHQLLKGDLNYARQLTFKYDQDAFTIGFSALNFIKSSKNRYAYRLVGFDHNWNYVDLPAATYTNLPAGDYQLLVKAANNDGVWNPQPTVLDIHILPPPWKTWWAYLIYIVVTVIILAYIRRFLRARMQLRQALFRERIEAEQQKKNYQQQLDFFTNMSHEIRTPLTLILGPVERLETIKIENRYAQQYISSIKNNANRLYRLVTELLDFRKAGENQLKLYLCEEDLIKFLKEIFHDFQSTAEIRDIDFQFNSQATSLMVYFDRNQLEKVFNNLLINAMKFTPAGGYVRISVREDRVSNQVEIIVEDNGKGIRKEDLDNVFENFYQADPSIGSGIGLALTKRLVELHKGEIKVRSTVATDGQNGATAFVVSLKLGREHLTNEHIIFRDAVPNNDMIYVDKEPTEEFTPDFNLPASIGNHTILLVEDNDEVREFVKQSLENDYQVIEAKNGQEGLSYATNLIPDLIISDVMMPVMDGLELCAKVKADIRTCHIPVILLTAKAAPIHLIQGLQQGADAYITKPFSTHVLHLNIHNMLALITAQQKKYNERLSLDPLPAYRAESEDEKLLQKLLEIIHQHMGNPDFDLTALTREVGMSKSVLYKKFSALTNQSLNNFIKTERLKKAVSLFKDGETSVISVAVKVGFNDVKYFSKEFKKLYNITPNEYLNCGKD
jgi:signal transduction histidine kinase/CheY-like chemotaxis protein/streptogramin lyase